VSERYAIISTEVKPLLILEDVEFGSKIMGDAAFIKRIAAALNAQEERATPTMTPEEARQSQNWKGISGAIAYHLIDRHADNWADISVMMDAWLEANALNAQAGVVEALEDCIDSLEYVNRTHPESSGWGVRSERISKARDALAAVKGVEL
jgi:hypothetical protein